MNHTRLRPFKARIVIAALAATSLFACGGPPHADGAARDFGSVKKSRPVALAFFDTSFSFRDGMPKAALAYATVSARLPRNAREIVFRIDRELQRVRDDEPLRSDEEFIGTVFPVLKARASEKLTYLHLAVERAAQIARGPGGPVAVLLATDWYEEGMDTGDHLRLRRAAKELAANPRVTAVVVVGADRRNTERMADELAPLAGKLSTPLVQDEGLGGFAGGLE